MPESSNTPVGVLKRGTPEYDENRKLFFNKEETNRLPAEIHVVTSAQDVRNALRRARELGIPVGVRSGGHLPSKPSLIHDGILIDLNQLNHEVKYDALTHEVSFGPAVRVKEAWKATDTLGRFFPFGHAPDVALGGFCLAGGQGFFAPTWGATITQWITRLEVVVPDGQILIADRIQNQDLFWAARGGGQAFFGVVTRFWSKTIPKKKIFSRSHTFKVGDSYEDLLSFAFQCNDIMPKYFTEAAVCTMYPEFFATKVTDEEVSPDSPLLMAISITAYTDTLAQAENLLSAWDTIPSNIRNCLIETKAVAEENWEVYFNMQDMFNPQTPDQKWGINSILNDPAVPRVKLVEAIKPAMCRIPTRSSYGCIYMANIPEPDEREAVFSLPQQYYISTFTGWKDLSLEPRIREVMREAYQKAASVACGMYIADFDASSTSVHSPTVSAHIWSKYQGR